MNLLGTGLLKTALVSSLLLLATLSSGVAFARTNGAGSTPMNAGEIQQATPDTVESKSGAFDMTSYFRNALIPVANTLESSQTMSLKSQNLGYAEKAVCENSYRRVLNTRRLEIHVGFGYMDISEGQSYIFDGVPYPNSTSLDIFGRRAFAQLLMRRCSGQLEACGFTSIAGDSSSLIKTVRGPTGEAVEVIVRMANGSVSPNYDDNTTNLLAQQTEQTHLAEDLFFGSVKSADALIYVGHSRNGGGPDFGPPVLRENGHPNYAGYYMAKQPGFGHLLRELRAPGQNPMLIALLSCLSEHHFGRTLSKAAPETGFVLTGSPVLADYDQVLSTALATVDSLSRFQCGQAFQSEIDLAFQSEPHAFLSHFAGAPSIGQR